MTPKSSKSKRSTVKKETITTNNKVNKNIIVSPELRRQMIADAAYYKAEKRRFQGDYCIEDWLEAEKEIDELLKEYII